MNGKVTCEALKKVRKQIADANGIPYEPAVCTHKGNCPGTCPACEAEVRYIERELAARKNEKKHLNIVGVAKEALPSKNEFAKQAAVLAISAAATLSVLPAGVKAQRVPLLPIERNDSKLFWVKGVVQDEDGVLTNVSVIRPNTGESVTTDKDGRFKIRVAKGEVLLFWHEVYGEYSIKVEEPQDDLVVIMEQPITLLPPIECESMASAQFTGLMCLSESRLVNPNNALLYSEGARFNSVSGQPEAPISVLARGYNTLIKGSQLYVNNGAPIDGNFSWNPLQSINKGNNRYIELIYDGRGMAMYGSSAANGATLVSDVFNNGVSYYGEFSLSQFSKRYNMMNAPRYADYVNAPLIVNDRGESDIGLTPAADTDWQDVLFRNALGHSHRLDVGEYSNDKFDYNCSLGYTSQDGVIASSGFESVDGKVMVNVRPSKRVNFGARVKANRQQIELVNIAKPWFLAPTVYSFKGTDNNVLVQNLLQLPTDRPYHSGGSFAGPENAGGGTANTIAEVEDCPLQRKETNIYGSTYLNFMFPTIKWNNFFSVNSANVDECYKQLPCNYGAQQQTSQEAMSLVGDFYSNHMCFSSGVEYPHEFRKKHKTKLSLQTVLDHYNWEEQTTGKIGTSPSYNQFNGDGNLFSVLGTAEYRYKHLFDTDVFGRYERTNGLLVGKQHAFYPACALNWRFHEIGAFEGFFRDADFGKNFEDVSFVIRYGESGNNFLSQPVYWQLLSENPDLKWERTRQVDALFNVDVSCFDVMLKTFYKRSEDLIMLDQTSGSFINAGTIENKGFETVVFCNTANSQNTFFTMTKLAFSKVFSKVLDLGPYQSVTEQSDPYGSYRLFGTEMSINQTEKGGAPGRFYGYKSLGIIQNEAEKEAYNVATGRTARVGDEKFSAGKTYIGDPNPDFTYSLCAEFHWKRWSIAAGLTGSQGNDVYNLVRQRISSQTEANKYCNLLADCITFAQVKTDANGNDYVVNASTQMPRPDYSATGGVDAAVVSDRFVEDGSYLKLQHLSLAYEWTAKKKKKWNINQLKAKFSVENLHTFTKYSGYDPENPGCAIRQGVDEGRYPSPRTYRFSVSVKF